MLSLLKGSMSNSVGGFIIGENKFILILIKIQLILQVKYSRFPRARLLLTKASEGAALVDLQLVLGLRLLVP